MFPQWKNLATEKYRLEIVIFQLSTCNLSFGIFTRKIFLKEEFSPFRGGESEALKRLKESLKDKVCCYWPFTVEFLGLYLCRGKL